MKFFYLAHSTLSLKLLEDLISKDLLPEFVVIHKNLDNEKLDNSFYKPISELCLNRIELYRVNSINEIRYKVEGTQLGICAGFMEIIKRDIFTLPEFGIINLHCGKLPEYRGRAPISRAIMNGDKNIVMTVHKINEGIDSGDIILEHPLPVTLEDDVSTMYEKCSSASSNVIYEAINLISRKKFVSVKQKINDKKANGKLSDDERKLNFEKPASDIFNKVRSLTGNYGGAILNLNGLEHRIYWIEVTDIKSDLPGIIKLVGNDVLISCADYFIKIIDVRDSNGSAANLKTLLRNGEMII
jgi:methionyl-tRNA formyltransferase